MIKINHTNIQQVCQDYTDFVFKKNRHLNKDNQYIAYVFSERNFKDIVSCSASNLQNEINLFHERFSDINYKADEWTKFKIYMIGQYEQVRKEYLQKVLDSLNLSVCPYLILR